MKKKLPAAPVEEAFVAVAYRSRPFEDPATSLRRWLSITAQHLFAQDGALHAMSLAEDCAQAGWVDKGERGFILNVRGSARELVNRPDIWHWPPLVECASFGVSRRGAVRRFVDWNVDQVLCQGIPTKSHPQLRLGVGAQFLRDHSDAQARAALVEAIGAYWDEVGMYFGLMEVARSFENGVGYLYDNSMKYPVKMWQRGVEEECWGDLGESRSQFVRGVFWGTFLGAEHLRRAGGSAFLDDFRRFA